MSEANFSKVAVGMSKDDVRGILGKPTEVLPLALKKQDVWSWRYEGDNKMMMFNAYFDQADGKVVRVSRDIDWGTHGGA